MPVAVNQIAGLNREATHLHRPAILDHVDISARNGEASRRKPGSRFFDPGQFPRGSVGDAPTQPKALKMLA